jgi:sentrin-specific protease 8
MAVHPIACLDGVPVSDFNLASLHRHECVDDVILHFHSSLLNRIFPSHFFASPAITELLLFFTAPSITAQLFPLELSHYSLVFFPVPSVERTINKHWSLLVWRPRNTKGSPTFYHFDSCGNINSQSAKRLAQAIASAFHVHCGAFRNARTPKQMNGYDCGIYVMLIAEYLAAGLPANEQMGQVINEKFAEEFRRNFEGVIRGYAENPVYEGQFRNLSVNQSAEV